MKYRTDRVTARNHHQDILTLCKDQDKTGIQVENRERSKLQDNIAIPVVILNPEQVTLKQRWKFCLKMFFTVPGAPHQTGKACIEILVF